MFFHGTSALARMIAKKQSIWPQVRLLLEAAKANTIEFTLDSGKEPFDPNMPLPDRPGPTGFSVETVGSTSFCAIAVLDTTANGSQL